MFVQTVSLEIRNRQLISLLPYTKFNMFSTKWSSFMWICTNLCWFVCAAVKFYDGALRICKSDYSWGLHRSRTRRHWHARTRSRTHRSHALGIHQQISNNNNNNNNISRRRARADRGDSWPWAAEAAARAACGWVGGWVSLWLRCLPLLHWSSDAPPFSSNAQENFLLKKGGGGGGRDR